MIARLSVIDNRRLTMLLGLVAGLAALLLVHFILLHTYWDYSEGVYAETSRLMIHGHALYRDVVGAQPPGVFLFGAAVLLVHDSLEWLRFVVACWQLLAGMIAARVVWRLTQSRAAAVITPLVFMLTPWAVHEHGALTPELVALPLLLGLLVARRPLTLGLLCGLLPLIKVPYALPAVAVLLLGPAPEGEHGRRQAIAWALGTLCAGLAITTGLGGGNFWRDAFSAQTQSGYVGLGTLKGYWAQSLWNLLGLLVPAAFAIRRRDRTSEPRLLRTCGVLAVAMLLTFATNVKNGTGLNIAVPVEGALVPLAMCGLVLVLRGRRTHVVPAVLAVLAIAFALAQSVSLLVSPHHSEPFLRAFSKPAWPEQLNATQFDRSVALARTCPAGEPYGGPPLIAFAAGEMMLDDQPDQFLVPRAAVLAPVEARVLAAQAKQGNCQAGVLSAVRMSP